MTSLFTFMKGFSQFSVSVRKPNMRSLEKTEIEKGRNYIMIALCSFTFPM